MVFVLSSYTMMTRVVRVRLYSRFPFMYKSVLVITNVFIIGLDIEPKKLRVHSSLVESMVEPMTS